MTTRVYCKYDGKFLYDADSSDNTNHYCKYGRPDCVVSYRNFLASLEKAENSDNEFIRNIALEIRIRLESGEYPKDLKALLKMIVKRKSVHKIFVPEKRTDLVLQWVMTKQEAEKIQKQKVRLLLKEVKK